MINQLLSEILQRACGFLLRRAIERALAASGRTHQAGAAQAELEELTWALCISAVSPPRYQHREPALLQP